MIRFPCFSPQMGYANIAMVNHGIHTRLYARSYIVCDDVSGTGSGDCAVFVNLDCGMTAQIVKMEVSRTARACNIILLSCA